LSRHRWLIFRHPACRWQTIFAAVAPLAKKPVQNTTHCGIRATVLMQAGKSRPIAPRLFRNTEQCLRHPPGLDMVSWHRTSRYAAASMLPTGSTCALPLFNVR
jgi:hypothetical protein